MKKQLIAPDVFGIIKGEDKLGINSERDIINIGNDFTKEYLLSNPTNPEDKGLSINCFKIIFEIFKILYEEQIHKGEQAGQQLVLFENEYMTEDDIYRVFKIKNSKITRNTDALEEALFYLVNHKKQKYRVPNYKGEMIRTSGGLFSDYKMSEQRGYTLIFISSYWLKKLIYIVQGYNPFITNVIDKGAGASTVRFILWLNNRKSDGERLTLEYLNDMFKTNSKTAKEFCRDFLRPKKNFLDKNGLKSFGYRSDGKTHVVIERYTTKTLNQDNLINPKTVNKFQLLRYKVSYYKMRHKLTDEQATILRREIRKNDSGALFDRAYERFKIFIKTGVTEKKLLTDYKGEDFMKTFQYIINQLCQEEKGEMPQRLWPVLI
jgi:hypothetical protein